MKKVIAEHSRILVVLYAICILFLVYMGKTVDRYQLIKIALALGILVPIAIIDWKEHRIPNKLLLIWLGIRMLLFVFEVFFPTEKWEKIALSALIAAIIGAGFLFVISLIAKNGIGMGDVKLFGVLGITFGIEVLYSTLFYSALFGAATGILLLLLKKVDRKSRIPFAPFILTGMVVSLAFIR